MDSVSTKKGTEQGWNRSRQRTQRTERNGMDRSRQRTQRTERNGTERKVDGTIGKRTRDLAEGPCFIEPNDF